MASSTSRNGEPPSWLSTSTSCTVTANGHNVARERNVACAPSSAWSSLVVSPAAHACTNGERTSSAASSGTRPITANNEAITKATMRGARERRLAFATGRLEGRGLGRGVAVGDAAGAAEGATVGGGRNE